MMDPHRKHWNEQQQKLQSALKQPIGHPEYMELFLGQHAALHAADMAGTAEYSFEEAVWEGLSEAAARCIPARGEHSIAWVFWHLARIEDVTMNVLLAGMDPVFNPDWQARLCVQRIDTGNSMDLLAVEALSAEIDLRALREYRSAVGRRTREIVLQTEPPRLRQKVDPARIELVRVSGAVLPEASGLLDYWGGRTLAGLLLMPPTRHNFLHLNEAERIKKANG